MTARDKIGNQSTPAALTGQAGSKHRRPAKSFG
jgi:hypothetical protein